MSKMSREDLLKLLAKCNPRTRKTVIRVLEGKVSQDDAAFIQEQLSFIEPDLTVRQVDFVSSRLCDAGHALDPQTRLIGQCQYPGCQIYICSTAGCGYTCSRCGKLVCRIHARQHGANEVTCLRCSWFVFLRELILGKRK
jgi:DNA-directed RNA polymerase subunit RPC12/RpoP